jgi:hypothetical protein
MHKLTEDVIMEFLPPGVKGGVSYCCRYERPGVNRSTAHILKNSISLSKLFDFLSELEERIHAETVSGASGHIQVAEPSCWADSIHKYCGSASLH